MTFEAIKCRALTQLVAGYQSDLPPNVLLILLALLANTHDVFDEVEWADYVIVGRKHRLVEWLRAQTNLSKSKVETALGVLREGGLFVPDPSPGGSYYDLHLETFFVLSARQRADVAWRPK
jgi:hypothetical protein